MRKRTPGVIPSLKMLVHFQTWESVSLCVIFMLFFEWMRDCSNDAGEKLHSTSIFCVVSGESIIHCIQSYLPNITKNLMFDVL